MAKTLTGKERYRTHTQDLDWTEERASVNVGDWERVASAVTAGGLIAAALLRRSRSGFAMGLAGAALLYRGVTGHCPVYHALGANTNDLGRRKVHTGRAEKIERRIRIARPPEELYRFWRNVENLPRVMSHVKSVKSISPTLSHWVVASPAGVLAGKGLDIEWDAEIINEVPNERIGWRSLAGSEIDTAGSVQFEPVAEGTELRVTLQYEPPGGRLGAAVAKLLGDDPERKIDEDLQRFKRIMEGSEQTGERRA